MMRDLIFSRKTHIIYADIEYDAASLCEYHFIGKIKHDNIPYLLRELISEYNILISEFSISLSDDIEDKISKYDLILLNRDCKIFCIDLKADGFISFFTKYPTSHGFVDDYPPKSN